MSQVSFLRSHDWHKLSQASGYRLGLSVWFTPQTERVIVLSKILALNKSLALLLSVLLAASVGTIAIEQYRCISSTRQFCQSQGFFFTCARPILEYDVSNRIQGHLHLPYLLAKNKRPCWKLQVQEWGDGLVYANDMFTSIPFQMMRRKIQVL